MKKSEWKRTVKDKVKNQIQERVEKRMENKTKLRTVREDKQEKKLVIATCDSDQVKGIIKIKLHMCELKKNYPREEEDMKCLICICNQKEDNRTCCYQSVKQQKHTVPLYNTKYRIPLISGQKYLVKLAIQRKQRTKKIIIMMKKIRKRRREGVRMNNNKN